MPTNIEWCDEVWNPSTGCDRTSPGCTNCYALTLAKRLKGMGLAKYQNDGDPRTSGPGFGLTLHPESLDIPRQWKRPRKVFVNSMSDLFHEDVPFEFIFDVYDVMAQCPQHTFQILTKRSQRMQRIATVLGALPNVVLGVSIENDRYTFRADHLRATSAYTRFISAEPLLGPLPSLDFTGIDWLIIGGESGPGARPMHPDWCRDLRDRAVAAGVATLFKQWGEWAPVDDYGDAVAHIGHVKPDGTWHDHTNPGPLDLGVDALVHRPGKKAAGRLLDGRLWDEYPVAHPTDAQGTLL